MNCDQFRKQLLEWGTLEMTAEERIHIGACAGCAAMFQQQRKLAAGLKKIAAAQAGWSASPRVEAALIGQFRSRIGLQRGSAANVPRMPFLMRFRLPALAAAGVLAAVFALLLISRAPHPSPTVAGATISQPSEIDDDSALDNGFVPLPYFGNSGELDNAADADVVRVEMPRSTLVTLGVPVNEDGNSATVEAELLLGEGGVPQAVRVLE